MFVNYDPRNPEDANLQVVSRTVGPDRVIGLLFNSHVNKTECRLICISDEFVYQITHTRTVDWLLPGVPATGKKLAIPMIAVVNIRGDRLYNGDAFRIIDKLR